MSYSGFVFPLSLFSKVEFGKGKHLYYTCLQFLNSVIYFSWGILCQTKCNQKKKKEKKEKTLKKMSNFGEC